MQGLTEFLPVSSSGHLTLAGHFFGVTGPQLVFDVMVHGATLVAVIVFYRRDLALMLSESWRALPTLGGLAGWRSLATQFPHAHLAAMVLVASLPTAIIGLVFKDQLEALFAAPRAVAGALLVTAGALVASRFAPAGDGRLGVARALIVGVVQGVAIIPGISRSGSTIVAALFCGVGREDAARFSFLLSLPAVAGAVVLHLKHLGGETAPAVGPLAVGAVAALLSGLLALRLLVPLVKRGRLHWFAVYLVPAGIISLVLL